MHAAETTRQQYWDSAGKAPAAQEDRPHIVGYIVRDRRTGRTWKYRADQRRAAYRRVDRLDNAYGGYIAVCQTTWSDQANGGVK